MYLVFSEALIDAVDGLHKPFPACPVFCLLRRKKVQLHAAVALQLREDNTRPFILIMRQIDAFQQCLHGLNNRPRVIGRRGQFERLVDVVLRQVGAVSVGSQKDRHGAA